MGIAVGTVTSQQEILCLFVLCLRGFTLRTLASSHTPKHVIGGCPPSKSVIFLSTHSFPEQYGVRERPDKEIRNFWMSSGPQRTQGSNTGKKIQMIIVMKILKCQALLALTI